MQVVREQSDNNAFAGEGLWPFPRMMSNGARREGVSRCARQVTMALTCVPCSNVQVT